jgi:hypothetical protein
MQQNAAGMANQQKSQDLQQAYQQRMGYTQNPYTNYAQGSQMQNIGAQQQGNAALNSVNQQQMGINQSQQDMWSQLYGGWANTGANAVKTGAMGGA